LRYRRVRLGGPPAPPVTAEPDVATPGQHRRRGCAEGPGSCARTKVYGLMNEMNERLRRRASRGRLKCAAMLRVLRVGKLGTERAGLSPGEVGVRGGAAQAGCARC
jgi:hypothetical protein